MLFLPLSRCHRWIALGLLLPTLLLAESPFSYEDTPGILPKAVVPTHYNLRLVPDLEQRTFAGTAVISVMVRKPVTEVVLHALALEIDHIDLIDGSNPPVPLTSTYAEKTQTLTVPVKLAPGAHTLRFQYRGKIGTTAQGFFVDRYETSHGEKLMLGTQMEVAEARRVFPCWDEPVFRATFDISLVIPKKMMGVSNLPVIAETPVDETHKLVTFARTPAMSTYLVAIYAGEFAVLSDELDGVKLRILATEGKLAGASYPMEVVKRVLAFQNDYFGTKYPLPKLDHIGVPNAFSGFGAMENWGAITYIDTALLFDPAKGSQAGRERVFQVIAHETAHQWFGNLVTLAWWNNLWLNEGFASWLETKTSDALNPSWHVWLRANANKETAMRLDAQDSTHPILQPIANESQAANGFDSISYLKGQSFLRMLENYLGEKPFRDGIRLYINRHLYSNATTADLWAAMEEASGKPVSAIATDWTERPGFPIVTAARQTIDGQTKLVLNQQRFSSGQPHPQSAPWKIPVTYARLGNFDQSRTVLMEDRDLVLPWPDGSGPLKLNVGNNGFYRVQYADDLATEISPHIAELPPEDQLNLLSDTWALAKAQRIPVTRWLDLATGLRDSEYRTVLELILTTIGGIDGYEVGQPGRAAYQQWALTILKPLHQRFGWEARPDESPLDAGIRADLIELLGQCGDGDTLAAAHRKFQAYRADPTTLPGNLIGPVLNIVGRHADRVTYDQLHAIARQAIDTRTKRYAYHAMQSALDPALIETTMQLTLSDDMPTSESNRNLSRLAGLSENPSLVLHYAVQHFDQLIARVGNFEAYKYLPSIATYSTDPADADLLMATIKEKLPAEALPVAARAAENILQKADFKNQVLPQIDAWVRAQSNQRSE